MVYLKINILMVVATAYIGAAWHCAEESIKLADGQENNETKVLYKTYKGTGKFVSVVQGAFQPWFVLQWIAYFVGIIQQCQSLKTIIDEIYPEIRSVDEFVNNHLYCILLGSIRLFLSLLLFVIPYGCGILMNKYYDKYIFKLKKELKGLLESEDEQSDNKKKRILTFIIKHTDYRFTPSIAGIQIPLNTVGHQLTILVTIIAPLLS